jgi:glycosyltransferase involved in cell wall biosynthesis
MKGKDSLCRPKISVCIPAYNRPREISELLHNLSEQDLGGWNIVICEDRSPQSQLIEQVVYDFSECHAELDINYYTNEKTLGYDGNIRMLLDKADGQYCLFMGDDDMLAAGSLSRIIDVLAQPNVGIVLRAWKSIDKETGKEIDEHRYFPEDRLFSPGIESIASFYRRSVFISGLTVHRDSARAFHTDRFDGMLLYQLYLVGRILLHMNGYYVSDILAVRRVGGEHFFGSSDAEKGRFFPKKLLPSHSVAFLRGLFDIARVLDEEFSPGVLALINKDLGRYSYPMLEIQARTLTKKEFLRYAYELASIGLGDVTMFWLYFYALLILGPKISNLLMRTATRFLGYTPNLAGSSGETVL